jgi:hypothetical protein
MVLRFKNDYFSKRQLPYPASYTMGARSEFPGGKRPRREAEHSPPLVLRSRMVELYLHSPIYLHVVVLR